MPSKKKLKATRAKYDKKRRLVLSPVVLTEPQASDVEADINTLKKSYCSAREGVLAAIKKEAARLRRRHRL